MSKELEALEIECGELVEMDLLFLDRNGENQEKWHNSEAFKKAIEFEKKYGKSHTHILKQALQRLEAIDNANPSEALECLKDLERNIMLVDDSYAVKKDYSIIEQTLLKAQEQEKVLKIIKEKNVNISLLKASSTLEQYNDELVRVYGMRFIKDKQLTEEEFDLLKRWLDEVHKD